MPEKLTRAEREQLAELAARGHHRAARAAALWAKAEQAKPMSRERRHHDQAAARVGRQALRDARRGRDGGPRTSSPA